MYSTVDIEAQAFADPCRVEAERIWTKEKDRDTILNMATAQFLSLAYIGQGRDHAVIEYLTSALEIGVHLGVFGADHVPKLDLGTLPPNTQKAYKYTSWGVYNYIMSVEGFSEECFRNQLTMSGLSRSSINNLGYRSRDSPLTSRRLETRCWDAKTL